MNRNRIELSWTKSPGNVYEPFGRAVRVLALAFGLTACTPKADDDSGTPGSPVVPAVDSEAAIREFCSVCHRFPAPEILPRERWPAEIRLMYELYAEKIGGDVESAPPMEAAIAHYTERAPDRLPPCPSSAGAPAGSVSFRRTPIRLGGLPPYPAIADVQIVHLLDETRPEVLFCEMRFNKVYLARPTAQTDRIVVLGKVRQPCRAEVVDLDRDGRRDVLVSSLGTVTPSDVTTGSVVLLRATETQSFRAIPLATGLGRVADARAADFDGDGDLDVVVAVFGWRKIGRVIWLENRGVGRELQFEVREIDRRSGSIQVPVADLDGDGRPDFVALFGQQHEAVVAFLNRGGVFEARTLFTAPHPNWGCSGLSLDDLDGDGDLDAIVSNGDTLDDLVLKPYHGVEWLENLGNLSFRARRLADVSGAHAAKAVDLDGDGDRDVVVSTFIPFLRAGRPGVELAESLLWLEQIAPGKFERRPLESVTCFHPAFAAGDLDLDGDADLVVGNMSMAKKDGDDLADSITIWENLSR